jgi:hypothetical protein
MKENDGRASRRKTHRQLWYGGLILGGLFLFVAWKKWDNSLDQYDESNHLRLLRQAKKHAERRHHDGGNDNNSNGDQEYNEAKVMKRVLSGDLQLIDVTVVEKELLRAPSNSYAGVYGKFCRLDWSRRKVDPSAGMCGSLRGGGGPNDRESSQSVSGRRNGVYPVVRPGVDT